MPHMAIRYDERDSRDSARTSPEVVTAGIGLFRTVPARSRSSTRQVCQKVKERGLAGEAIDWGCPCDTRNIWWEGIRWCRTGAGGVRETLEARRRRPPEGMSCAPYEILYHRQHHHLTADTQDAPNLLPPPLVRAFVRAFIDATLRFTLLISQACCLLRQSRAPVRWRS